MFLTFAGVQDGLPWPAQCSALLEYKIAYLSRNARCLILARILDGFFARIQDGVLGQDAKWFTVRFSFVIIKDALPYFNKYGFILDKVLDRVYLGLNTV
jgi:hypothetical protein